MQLGIAQTFGKHRLSALQLLYRQLCLKLYTIFCVYFFGVFCFKQATCPHVFCLSIARMYAIMSDNGQMEAELSCEMRLQRRLKRDISRILIIREEASGVSTAYNQ